MKSSWLCCQLGAREHYAIPRALKQQNQLSHLITDAWIEPHSPLPKIPTSQLARLCERFHLELADTKVLSYTPSLLYFELQHRLKNNRGWGLTIARNHWFQKQVVKTLDQLEPQLSQPPILFSYSYTALMPFRYAKQRGWRTVLGQIDPGPVEEQLVLAEHRQRPDYRAAWQPAPDSYWLNWQEECDLADHIVVNSVWSKEALQQAGVPGEKIKIVPLAYTPPQEVEPCVRTYPTSFTPQRPLRVLFLGQIILRKGIGPLLEAAHRLHDRPVEFWLVGSLGINPAHVAHLERVKWVGPVSRSETTTYYQTADVFILPTLSDGFAITQLEAQAWKLPLIASPYCGAVVQDGVNGLLLPEVSTEAIIEAVDYCLRRPGQLQQFSQNAIAMTQFSLDKLQQALQSLS